MQMENKTLWQGDWIESHIYGGPRTCCPAPYFRRRFEVTGRVKKAVLHISALGIYEASINGKPAHDTVLTPGWTVFEKRVRYQSWDVTEMLKEGANAIGVILGDGWYSGHVAGNDRQGSGERPRLLTQLEWTTNDGEEGMLVSDENWKVSTGPILENDLLSGEAYDARKELKGWDEASFDDSAWCSAKAFNEAGDIEIQPQYGPFVRRIETLEGMCIGDGGAGERRLLYDLGQNITGRVRLKLKGERGTTLRIRYGEMLNGNGGLYTANLRGARSTDFYTLKGGETETWEPVFTFHGFRYVELTWTSPGEPGKIKAVDGVVLHSEMNVTGHFECSNSLLNKLYKNTVWGQKGNFLEVPTDCPQRDERLGWTGDAQVFIRTAAFNMDVSDFFRKWLLDMRDSQFDNGSIPPYIPYKTCFGVGSDGGPAWADAAMICPVELYRAYGETDFISEHYNCMVSYMDFLAENKVKDGIRSHADADPWGGFGDWLALDGSNKNVGNTPKDLIGTAFYANNARILSECAALLGKREDVSRWDRLYRDTVEVFRNRFLTPDGLVAAGTQTACVLALHFNLVRPEQRSETEKQLITLIKQNGMKIGTGFVGTPYLLHVLEAAGRIDIAYSLLEEEGFPSWLFPVKNGATTIWERWDGWTPERGFQDPGMNSFNHYAYGAVCDWMVGTVAGLVPAEPGYKSILFKPRPGGSLTMAAARLETRFGAVSVQWQIKGDKLMLEFTVPDGTSAVFVPPQGWESEKQDLKPGTHSLELRKE